MDDLMRFCFLLLCPIFLHAGWINWLFPPLPQYAQAFDCLHHCGEWGSESIQRVEWQGVLAIYELDKMGHACLEKPFPYPDLPKDWNDPWCQRALEQKIFLIAPLNRKAIKACARRSAHHPYETNYTCFCEEEYADVWFGWELAKMTRGPGKNGIEFYFDYDQASSAGHIISAYDYYNELIYFDSYPNLKVFYRSLSEDIKEYFTEHVKWQCFINNEGCFRSTPACLLSVVDEFNKTIEQYNEKIPLLSDKKAESNKRYVTTLGEYADEFKLEIERWANLGRRYDLAFKTHMPSLEARLESMLNEYSLIFDRCINEHQAPASYYSRAVIRYDTGENVGCIEDIQKLFEIAPSELIAHEVSKKLELMKGTAQSEIGLFNEAILTLSHYIDKHPNHREAYVERAIAQFEIGSLQDALQDFVATGLKGRPVNADWKDELDFSRGLIEGITEDGLASSANFLPAALSSISGLSHGLWALVTTPEQTTKAMYNACQEAYQYIKSEGFDEIIHTVVPEFRTLIQEGQKLSYIEQGELIGKIIGRIGIEFVLLKGTTKGLKIYRDLRKANAMLSLEGMATSIEAEQILLNCHKQWWSKIAPIIEEIQSNGGRLGDQLYKAFRKQQLSEFQVRKILHQAGFKTFPRPKGIPSNSTVQISKKNGGMVYIKAGTTENECILARVMPGNPNSPNPMQRKPYVVQRRGKDAVSKSGELVDRLSPEAHIPLEEFSFKGW